LVKIRKNFERYLRGFSFILFSKKIFLFDDSEIKFTESDFFIVDGFWQDKKYIDNDFISELKYAIFKNQLDSNALNLSGIVCIHIRRGDYLNNRRFFKNTQIVLDESYYKNAINFYTSQNNSYKFHIFTDDEDWAKNVFHDNYDIDIVDSKDLPPIEILKKMSSYSNFIIGNSTLSWWAAALSDGLDKVVILPKIWGVNSTSDNLSLPGWKQL
jgi:hypothetical protein